MQQRKSMSAAVQYTVTYYSFRLMHGYRYIKTDIGCSFRFLATIVPQKPCLYHTLRKNIPRTAIVPSTRRAIWGLHFHHSSRHPLTHVMFYAPLLASQWHICGLHCLTLLYGGHLFSEIFLDKFRESDVYSSFLTWQTKPFPTHTTSALSFSNSFAHKRRFQLFCPKGWETFCSFQMVWR